MNQGKILYIIMALMVLFVLAGMYVLALPYFQQASGPDDKKEVDNPGLLSVAKGQKKVILENLGMY